MKKSIALILAMVVCISSVFVACSNKPNKDEQAANNESTTTPDGLEANADNYIMDTVEVTDKDGKTVTDKNGDPVTEDVVYKEVTKKNGDKVAILVDDNGEEVKDSKGETITMKITTTEKSKEDKSTTDDRQGVPDPAPSNPISTVHTEAAKQPTEANLTTIKPADDKVPKTSASGTPVKFSEEDAVTVAQMLSVPYFYNASYENSDGVPTNIAAHAAMWMAEKEGLNTKIFASGTIVLDLFKFFGQTVVNFKTKCNNDKDQNNVAKDYSLKYSSNNDTFSISGFENYTHTVDNLSFYSLGNNNYYKVTGTVKKINGSDCKAKKVTAVIQRNKLDANLGFSVKAVQWS